MIQRYHFIWLLGLLLAIILGISMYHFVSNHYINSVKIEGPQNPILVSQMVPIVKPSSNISSMKTYSVQTLSSHHLSNSIKPLPVSVMWTYVSRSTLAYRTIFYDDRRAIYGGPVLIVFVSHDQRIEKNSPKLYIEIVYSNHNGMILPTPGKAHRSRKPKHDEFVLSYKIIYHLPTNERPEFAFLCTNDDCSHKSAHLSVFTPTEQQIQNKVKFSVCLHQPLFNHTGDHEKVVAWIEMNRALGAERIYIYYQDIEPDVMRIIQKYVDEGIVEAFDWFNNFTTVFDNNFGQAILIDDCLYRSRYTTEYLALHDLDELLIPHRSSTWEGFINEIGNTDSISIYRFCHAAFHNAKKIIKPKKTIQPCVNVTEVPIMFRRTRRTKNLRCNWTRWKNIVVPERVDGSGIHSAGSIKGFKMYKVPPKLGLLHHYRGNDYFKDTTVEDLTVAKYSDIVMSSMAKRLCTTTKNP